MLLANKLENIGGISKDQAKKELFDTLQAEVKLANEKWIQKVEEESRQIAKERSNQIIVSAMQRYTIDQVSPNSSSVVHLPVEESNTLIIPLFPSGNDKILFNKKHKIYFKNNFLKNCVW